MNKDLELKISETYPDLDSGFYQTFGPHGARKGDPRELEKMAMLFGSMTKISRLRWMSSTICTADMTHEDMLKLILRWAPPVLIDYQVGGCSSVALHVPYAEDNHAGIALKKLEECAFAIEATDF